MNYPFVHSKVFYERIIRSRNWRQQGIKKDRILPSLKFIFGGLANKLMNKKTEI